MNDQMPQAGTPIYQESQGKSAKWLWLLVILVVIGALVFAYIKGLGPFSQFRLGSKTVESPSPESAVYSSPLPESTSAATVDRAAAKIRVLNGSGKAGVASSMKDLLESKGYKVTAIGNAQNYDYENTEILTKEDFSNYGEVLVSDLSDNYSVKISSDILEATDSADIEVIIGSK